MNYILDTNVCIQILKGRSEKIKVKLENISNDMIGIPTVVRYELFFGAYKSNNPDKTLATVKEFIAAFPALDFDDEIAEKSGEIRATLEKLGAPIGPYDLLIAATAVVKGKILVTNNTREMSRVQGIKLEDWQ